MSKETLVYVINVGKSCRDSLEKMKFVVQKSIERKIFLRPKDEIGIILMGSDICKNELDYDNVYELGNVQVPTWDMVEQIMKLKSTNCAVTWVEAIDVAIEYAQRECVDAKTRKIVLLSDFSEEYDIMIQFESDAIANKFKNARIGLLAIGNTEIGEVPDDSLTYSAQILKRVCKEINGQYLTLDSTMPDVRFYKTAPTRPLPWYCALELLDIKIPIASYVKTKYESGGSSGVLPVMKKMHKHSDQSQQSKKEKVTEYINIYRESFQKEDTVTAYQYGDKTIPFPKDLKSMEYKGGEKCLKIHSFSPQTSIHPKYFLGRGVHIVVPSNDFAAKPFYCLVQAMVNNELVAIARKVYRNNTAPKMVALIPTINHPGQPWCLIEVELMFRDNMKKTVNILGTFDMDKLSKKEKEAVENLIGCVDTTGKDDEVEENDIECMPDPTRQLAWDMLAHLAINPKEPLPSPDEDFWKTYEPPAAVREKAAPYCKTIRLLLHGELVDSDELDESGAGLDDTEKESHSEDDQQISSVKKEKQVDNDKDADVSDELELSVENFDLDLEDEAVNV